VALRKNVKIEALKAVPLFARCSKKELGEMEGSADVRRKRRKVGTLGPGDFLGEIALVTKAPRTATVKTTSPVRALVVSEQNFRRLLAHSPQVQIKVLEALAERVAATSL
jgi:CRP/FNR family transcriptional regulator, cyclic AMP receptor protein